MGESRREQDRTKYTEPIGDLTGFSLPTPIVPAQAGILCTTGGRADIFGNAFDRKTRLDGKPVKQPHTPKGAEPHRRINPAVMCP